jgi:hypothetical protein
MQAITTIGLDIAKSVFQVHGVDADGQVVIRGSLAEKIVNLQLCLFLALIGHGRRAEGCLLLG